MRSLPFLRHRGVLLPRPLLPLLLLQWQVVHSDPGLLGWLVGGPATRVRRVLHSFSRPSAVDVFDFMAALFRYGGGGEGS